VHAGRQFSYRLIPLVFALGGCASSRYVGSIGETGVYSNLGYGLTLDLQASEVAARWQAIDPEAIDDAAAADRPKVNDAPVDLDGDGALTSDETMRHLRPTLRLIARSSSAAGARIDVDVVILGGDAASQTVDVAARSAARELISPEFVTPDWTVSELPGGYPVWTTESGTHRLAVIDQKAFSGEKVAAPRHQSVRVLLIAPTITEDLRRDFDRVVRGLSLSDKGGPVARQDAW